MSEQDEGRWTRIERRLVHQTPFLKLHEDLVRLPAGQTTRYGVVECGDCVGVLPVLEGDRVVLVRQFRYIAQRFTWEMPTGGVHEGEPLEGAAQRELAEEAGYRAGTLTHLCTYHTSKSSIDETAHLFLGEALVPARARPDDTEQIEIGVFPRAEVLSMVLRGAITDSMTIIAVLLAARRQL